MGTIRTSTTATVIDPADIGDHVGADGPALEGVLSACQRAAVDFIERECRIQIGPGTFELTTRFPAGREIVLPCSPLASVEVVKFIDPAGDEQTLTSSVFRVNATTQPGRIILRPGCTWPSTDDGDAVTIRYSAGWSVGSIPEGLLHAVRLLTAHLLENREATSLMTVKDVPFALTALLNQFRFTEVA